MWGADASKRAHTLFSSRIFSFPSPDSSRHPRTSPSKYPVLR
jgi:hypothetical protein